MNYRNYTLTTLLVVMMTMAVSAKQPLAPVEDFDLNSLVYIEEDQDWELGFDTAKYLPENFDPYSGAFSLKAINYIDLCDDVELNFDTTGYLPQGFDPYIQ